MPRRRAATLQRPAVDPQEQEAGPTPEEKVKQAEQTSSSYPGGWSGPVYYLWQYGGVTLGLLACLGSSVLYDQKDPHRVLRLVAWMLLALVALLIHETRPFKRMNYGDHQKILEAEAAAKAEGLQKAL